MDESVQPPTTKSKTCVIYVDEYHTFGPIFSIRDIMSGLREYIPKQIHVDMKDISGPKQICASGKHDDLCEISNIEEPIILPNIPMLPGNRFTRLLYIPEVNFGITIPGINEKFSILSSTSNHRLSHQTHNMHEDTEMPGYFTGMGFISYHGLYPSLMHTLQLSDASTADNYLDTD